MVDTNLKTVLITGCTDGIGLGTITKLLTLGLNYKIIGTYRNIGKLDAIKQNLLEINPNYRDRVMFIELDLANIESIQTFASRLKGSLHQIQTDNVDIVCNNAGMRATRSFVELNDTLINKCLFVNLLAMYSVCRSVIDTFRVERCVSLSSVTHWSGNADIKTDVDRKDVAHFYPNSKLGVFYMTKLLKFCYPDISFVVVSPGFVYTNIFRKVTFTEKIFDYVSWICGLNVSESADVIIDAFTVDTGSKDYEYLTPYWEIWTSRFFATYLSPGLYQINDLCGRLFRSLITDRKTEPSAIVNNESMYNDYVELLDTSRGLIKNQDLSENS